MSGPRTLFRGIGFFGFLVFFVFFGFLRVFLIFGSGSFYRLLGPPITQKPRGKPKKQEKTQCSQECLGPFLQMQWCFMCFSFFCFVVFLFLFFGCGSRPPPENKPILLQTLSPINLSSIGFLLYSMLRVAVAKKSTNQGHEG